MSARFVDPPRSIYRAPRTSIDAGLLAVFGIVLAVLFLLLLMGMLETSLGLDSRLIRSHADALNLNQRLHKTVHLFYNRLHYA